MDIVLGAYETEQEAVAAMAQRSEPQNELSIVQDGDIDRPWRIHWARP